VEIKKSHYYEQYQQLSHKNNILYFLLYGRNLRRISQEKEYLVPDFEERVPGPSGNKKNPTIMNNIGSSHR
jgi:hypothetical protein